MLAITRTMRLPHDRAAPCRTAVVLHQHRQAGRTGRTSLCWDKFIIQYEPTLITEAHNQPSPHGGHVSNPALLIVGGVRRDPWCTITQFYISSPQVPLSPRIYHSKEKKTTDHTWNTINGILENLFILQVTTKSCRAPQRANSLMSQIAYLQVALAVQLRMCP